MRIIFTLLLSGILVACVSEAEKQAAYEQQLANERAADKQSCLDYGFALGTEQMSNCLIMENGKREERRRQRQANVNNVMRSQQQQQQQQQQRQQFQQQQFQQQQQQYQQQSHERQLQQQQMYQMNRPVQTNCNTNYFTGEVTCTSR